MDIKNTDWFGQLQMTGIAKPVNNQGSVLSMVGEFLVQLRTLNPREMAEGKTIVMTFSTIPIGQDKAKNDKLALVSAVTESLVESNDLTPLAAEPIESFIKRLMISGHTPTSARFIAADWYGVEDGEGTERLRAWLDNPKAIRFRELNARNDAFESAHPSEYRELLTQMLGEFPEFVRGMQLRIAI